jgi:hypothetical protein
LPPFGFARDQSIGNSDDQARFRSIAAQPGSALTWRSPKPRSPIGSEQIIDFYVYHHQ